MKLLDTSVLVDIDRGGVDEKVSRLDDQGPHAVIMITVTEFRLGVNLQHDRGSGAYREATEALGRLLSRVDLHPVTRPVATAAADSIAEHTEEGAGSTICMPGTWPRPPVPSNSPSRPRPWRTSRASRTWRSSTGRTFDRSVDGNSHVRRHALDRDTPEGRPVAADC